MLDAFWLMFICERTLLANLWSIFQILSRSSQGHLHHTGWQEGRGSSGQGQRSASVQRQLLLQQWISHLQRESVSHPLPAGAAHAVVMLVADGSAPCSSQAPSPANIPPISWCITVPYLAVPYVFDAVKSKREFALLFLLHCSCSLDFECLKASRLLQLFFLSTLFFHLVSCFWKTDVWKHDTMRNASFSPPSL